MINQPKKVEAQIFGTTFGLETGKLAKQTSGSVLASYGDTVVLATLVAAKEKTEGEDFLPLTVNYQEKSAAAGKIPGGFFKREGRPNEKEVLTSRLIDRPIRPLFPKEFTYQTQIIITVFSADADYDPDVLSVTAASAALSVSDVPFAGPLAAVRVGRVGGEFICNPIKSQLEESDMNIVVAGTKEAIVMVEGGSNEVSESDTIDALMFAHESIQEFIKVQEDLVSGLGVEKRVLDPVEEDEDFNSKVVSFAEGKVKEAIVISSKTERNDTIKKVRSETEEHIASLYPDDEVDISKPFEKLLKESVRGLIVNDKVRLDGRTYTDVRPISGEVGFLPRVHGSAVFTRGETQAAVTATLGTKYDEQRIDSLEGDITKTFMLHYNFPPYSVGETSFRLGPGRREIGHGALAERALAVVLPGREDFPYTLRVVSEVLESNGSSSMATVCGGTLSMLDAGVPISAPVSGIAMGLIKEGDDFVILSDILGDEDHLGDMDFKVAGTTNGITALQMDIKVTGVTREILTDALNQAKEGRLHILGEMDKILSAPREDISEYAPRIVTMQVEQNKIKDVIGSGGKTIKKIVEVTGVQIDIDDSGTVNIASPDRDACDQAIKIIEGIVEEMEVGKVYLGTVKRILDFGAIVELANGKDGLVHISELEPKRVEKVTDILNENDELLVKCIEKGHDGKIRLSRKQALDQNIEDYR
ncbi:MAG: polyribonucleotide nucleotidyltransferase [Thermodesulfobacteriota bacterium]|nr:MAG: polyribonucleotide nucleotidyltransferase [Thermodesulfobacteriota bacterium]